MTDTDRAKSPWSEDEAGDAGDPVRDRATKIIGAVRGLLDEELMARQFDEPIGRAAEAFECRGPSVYTHATFLTEVADFVRHVYEHGLPGRRRLSPSQARDEAVALLQRVYRGPDFDGYDAAAVEAANTDGAGIRSVLATLAEAMKAIERQTYEQWVAARYINAADWETKCAVAAVLRERLAEYLPPGLLGCAPEQLAHRVFDLLKHDLTTDKKLQWRGL